MKTLITGGNTAVMIDQVRCISNIFKGKTAEELATWFGNHRIPEDTILLTSNKGDGENSLFERIVYKTYDELYNNMKELIGNNQFDVIIHSAAVSDYKVEGTYDSSLNHIDSSTKISSDCKELYLKLIPTEKIIDKIRSDWGFKGKLVKFKLQVGISDEELIEIAKKSRIHSQADYIVANCLEWSKDRAYIISGNEVTNVERKFLRNELKKRLEK